MGKWTMPDNYREIFYEELKIPNYKELCELCGWKPTTGNSKISQLQIFESHIAFKPMGNKFLITEVRETPLEIEDGRAGNTNGSIYANDIETILYNVLANVDAKKLTLTKVGWLMIIGAVNKKFEEHNIMKSKNSDLAQTLNIDVYEVNDLMSKVEKNLWDSFDNVTTKLQRESLITQKDVLIYYKEFDKIGEIAERFTTDEDEYEEYREINKELLNEFGVKSESDLFKKKDEKTRSRYYAILNARTNSHFGWAGHYRAKTITYSQKQVQKTMDIFHIQKTKLKLNENVIAQAIKSSEDRHKKSKKKLAKYNIDEEGIQLAEELGLPESDYKPSYEENGMLYYYAQDKYTEHIKLILNELVAIKQ